MNEQEQVDPCAQLNRESKTLTLPSPGVPAYKGELLGIGSGVTHADPSGANAGHSSGDQSPWPSPPPHVGSPDSIISPRRKTLKARGRAARGTPAGAADRAAEISAASAAPPMCIAQRVATAIASHARSARRGSTIRVRSYPRPCDFSRLKPCSTHARGPYPPAPAAPGARTGPGSPRRPDRSIRRPVGGEASRGPAGTWLVW